ncbi:hypothetical protein [Marispirochaeta sp.]|uniref:hypothetical protein n=1 Tax=Marispirochaeta sp. TaxID=2038653 RepID=UPI0029C76368|nr:hypothetical protein [Marispirochaeta sp.]
MDDSITYRGFTIEPNVQQVGREHVRTGEWMSSEFLVGQNLPDRIERKQIILSVNFFESAEEAYRDIIERAKVYIDREY